MFQSIDGCWVIEVDNRLSELMDEKLQLKVTEKQFCQALKAYQLDDALITLGQISGKLYNDDLSEEDFWKRERKGLIIHKVTKQFITDFAIEYIANMLLISGSNNFRSKSIRDKDNLHGLFSIYFNHIIQQIPKGNLAALLVPMYYRQFSSQQDIKDVIMRNWIIFNQMNSEISSKDRMDLDNILFVRAGLTIEEYIVLSFLIFSLVVSKPSFSIGALTHGEVSCLDKFLTEEKVAGILKMLSATPEELRELDLKYNTKLSDEGTLNRYNPLWDKPIVKISGNTYIVPSISAYAKGSFKGLYWFFENVDKTTFRKYFGSLFENYVGAVLKDIYGHKEVVSGIRYGSRKDSREFFDWIVERSDSILLVESKGYQFPLTTLQTGDTDLIQKEVFRKIVATIRQMFERCNDIRKYSELNNFKDKKLVCLAVFYDIPFISTDVYDVQIKIALANMDSEYPGIKDFEYTLVSIEELEDYSYIKDYAEIENVVKQAKQTPGSGVSTETNRIYRENRHNSKMPNNLLDKKFKEFECNILHINDVDR